VLTTGFGFFQRFSFSCLALFFFINPFVVPLNFDTKNKFILSEGNPNAAIAAKCVGNLKSLLASIWLCDGYAGACQCALQVA